MINKMIKFIKKEYALIILCLVFLYFAVTFISGVFSYYRVKMSKPIAINEPFVKGEDKFLKSMERFHKSIHGEIDSKDISVSLDITDRFMRTIDKHTHKKVECWQCGKMIPFEKTSRSPRLASWRGRKPSLAIKDASRGKSAKAVLAAKIRIKAVAVWVMAYPSPGPKTERPI